MNIKLLNLALGGLLTIAAISAGCADESNDEANSTDLALKGGNKAAADGGLAKCSKSKGHDHDAGVKGGKGGSDDGDDAGDEAADTEDEEGDGGKGYGKGGKTDKAKGGNSGSAKGKCVEDDGTVVDDESDAAVHGKSGDNGKGGSNGKGHSDAGK
ncbi:MAG: hypothetical protein JWN48_2158 [Myxococcaceae bacterium]|nr:hypothetical protein [Myxococcaceae bacterium]